MWAGSLGALDIKKVTPWLATLFTKSIGSISIDAGRGRHEGRQAEVQHIHLHIAISRVGLEVASSWALICIDKCYRRKARSRASMWRDTIGWGSSAFRLNVKLWRG